MNTEVVEVYRCLLRAIRAYPSERAQNFLRFAIRRTFRHTATDDSQPMEDFVEDAWIAHRGILMATDAAEDPKAKGKRPPGSKEREGHHGLALHKIIHSASTGAGNEQFHRLSRSIFLDQTRKVLDMYEN